MDRLGRFDHQALQTYRDQLQALKDNNIEPMVTLHHFTDPLWLTQQGGWENPRTADRFARFVTRVVEAL